MIQNTFNLIIIIGSSFAALIVLKNMCYRCLETIDNYTYTINVNNHENNQNNDLENNYEYTESYDSEYSNDNIIDNEIIPDAPSDEEN